MYICHAHKPEGNAKSLQLDKQIVYFTPAKEHNDHSRERLRDWSEREGKEEINEISRESWLQFPRQKKKKKKKETFDVSLHASF